ncbi:signaling lymphocytic activation molecule-like [Salvelinus fontinalis]|uniref:signaling lymphocytic activation molecule-like n=1 Tax=Salvelinus fontinalis TaxID=8038 RepID=UPI0024852BA9|nr:signaling lymphocytic activation molecule-like [Salvelinus fontinalis]
MSGGPFTCFSNLGILLLLLSKLHYGVGVSSYSLFHKTVGESVEMPADLEGQNVTIMQWKYRGKNIAEFNSKVVYSPGSQFDGRLEMNVINFSLTIRKLTLQDSGEFLVVAETDKQIPTKAVTLQVQEPILKIAIQTDIKLLANQSCTVRLVCNVSRYLNITYTWERDNEMYGHTQQIHFSLSPAEGDISVKCNASNLVSWKTASATVKCSNDTTTPVTGQAWYSIYIGVSVGGAVVLILTVTVAVCYCRGRSNTEDLTDNTIYADVMDNTKSRDTRSNSQVNPISIYETVNDLVIPRLNKPQTLYDKITFGRREAHPSHFQEVL